jgi:hypothetical protein
MAKGTFEGTGVLRLTAVTPVIEALFSGYAIKPSESEQGEAYIRKSSDDAYPTWSQVANQLQRLAEGLGIAEKDDVPKDSEDLAALILALGAHYSKGKNVSIPLMDHEFENDAYLGELFDLAQLLDDGHGLVSLEIQSAAYSHRPIRSEFGSHGFFIGHGLFIGSGVVARSGSNTAVHVGQKLNQAVLAKDIDGSVRMLREQLAETMNWITDPEMKLEVAKRLGLPA